MTRTEPGRPAGGTVRVTAQWALWGKEARDVGYHLLGCSDGEISSENFDHVITRYSPGTLESLPQVTISWIAREADASYVGIAIHDTSRPDGQAPLPGRLRAGPAASYVPDRDIAVTSYFCVPYEELAAGAVTYTAMFESFRPIRLPAGSGEPIPAVLIAAGAEPPDRPGKPPGDSAMHVAALLMTGKPVCILRGERTGLAERLRFLDAVAALLPYGFRSRLSASTWTSSTYLQHRFRLFFSSAPRRRDDHVVYWELADDGPTGDPWPDRYRAWLREDPLARMDQLARQTRPINFTAAEMPAVFERLGIAYPGEPDPPRLFSRLREAQSAADLIRSCAAHLGGGDPAELSELRQRRDRGLTQEERASCREAVRECGLLRADLAASADLRSSLYRVLLPVAFGSPLTYDAYCQAEECAGVLTGEPPHPALLAAIELGELDGPFLRPLVRLLALAADNAPALGPPGPDNPLTPAGIVRLVAEPRLRRHHARMVWDAVQQRSGHLDRAAVQRHLRKHRYLAPDLEERYRDEPEYQVTVLSVLLRLAYGPTLGRPAVQEILENSDPVPSAGLLGALQINMDSGVRNRARLMGLLRWNAGISGPPEWRRERS
jgi:hypothetical protein